MADDKQLVILKALTVHLEGITPANGYQNDLTGKVFRGKTRFGTDTATPFISIVESLRPDPRPMVGGDYHLRRKEDWELLIQGWVDDDSEHPTDALYPLKAETIKRLAEVLTPGSGPVYRLGGLIIDLKIGPGVVRAATPQAGGSEAFYLPLLIQYAINLADPFALT